MAAERIKRVIEISRDILELLFEEGYKNLEKAVRKTKTLADILSDETVQVWLTLELNGVSALQRYKNPKPEEKEKIRGVHLWMAIHSTQDSEEKDKIREKILDRMVTGRDATELRKEEFELSYSQIRGESIVELIDKAQNPPERPEKVTSDFDVSLFRRSLIGHEEERLICNKLKSEIQDYVGSVYKTAVEEKDRLNNEIALLKAENEALIKKTFKYKIKKTWEWVKSHKKSFSLIALLTLLGAVAGILMFFRLDYYRVWAWFCRFFY